MKRIDIRNKAEIKLLLTCRYVLAVKGDQFQSFGGFQLWWYDETAEHCNSCETHWSDLRRRLQHHDIDKAVKTLWRCRRNLYIAHQHTAERLAGNHGFATESHADLARYASRHRTGDFAVVDR